MMSYEEIMQYINGHVTVLYGREPVVVVRPNTSPNGKNYVVTSGVIPGIYSDS